MQLASLFSLCLLFSYLVNHKNIDLKTFLPSNWPRWYIVLLSDNCGDNVLLSDKWALMSGMDFLGWRKLVPGQTTYKAWYLDRGQWSGLVPCQVMNCFRTAIHPANCAKKVYSAMRACANWTWSDIWIWNCFRGLYSPGVDNSRDRRDKIEARHEGIGHQAAANRLCVLCSV